MSHLTTKQKQILFDKDTELPFTSDLLAESRDGVYSCVNCRSELFNSDTKFESGSGWPSFNDIASLDAVKTQKDYSYGMVRDEVVCAKCGAHLGHLFDGTGYTPTKKYYCINGLALDFKPNQKSKTV